MAILIPEPCYIENWLALSIEDFDDYTDALTNWLYETGHYGYAYIH